MRTKWIIVKSWSGDDPADDEEAAPAILTSCMMAATCPSVSYKKGVEAGPDSRGMRDTVTPTGALATTQDEKHRHREHLQPRRRASMRARMFIDT